MLQSLWVIELHVHTLCCLCCASHSTGHSIRPVSSDTGLSPRIFFGQWNVNRLDMGCPNRAFKCACMVWLSFSRSCSWPSEECALVSCCSFREDPNLTQFGVQPSPVQPKMAKPQSASRPVIVKQMFVVSSCWDFGIVCYGALSSEKPD